MAQEEIVLAIDNGTQSVRALLFDPQGNLVAKSRVVIEPYFSEHPRWAEQRPEYFWESLCQACQQLWQQTDIPKADHSARDGGQCGPQRETVAPGHPLAGPAPH
jgi:sugar (pentulose or hexulose) kinase